MLHGVCLIPLPHAQALAVVLPEVNGRVEQIVANHEQWDALLAAAQ